MIDDGFVYIEDGGTTRRFQIVPTASPILQAYREMVGPAQLPCAPQIETVESLGGWGGIYLDGLILIGRNDVENITRGTWMKNAEEITALVAQVDAEHGLPRGDAFGFLRVAVHGRIVAHELGHAIHHMRGLNSPFVDGEATADWFAGQLDALRRRNKRIGEIVFASIGCEKLLCDHPTPEGRATAYRMGFEHAQRMAA